MPKRYRKGRRSRKPRKGRGRKRSGRGKRSSKSLSKGQTKAVKNLIKGRIETKYHHGAVVLTDINPAMSTAGDIYKPNDPPIGTPCFGNFSPNFDYGDDPYTPGINSSNSLALQDTSGGEISGRTIRYMGTRFTVVMTTNDSNTMSSFDEYYRMMLVKVKGADYDEVMIQADWSMLFRHDIPTTSASGSNTRNDMLQSYINTYQKRNQTHKIIKDTKWKKVRAHQNPPTIEDPLYSGTESSWQLGAKSWSWFVPDGRKYVVYHGALVDFRAINYAILGTWASTLISPDFSIRIDMEYKDS